MVAEMKKFFISVFSMLALLLTQSPTGLVVFGETDVAQGTKYNLAYSAIPFASSVDSPNYSIETLNDGQVNTSFLPSWCCGLQNPANGDVYAGLEWKHAVKISRVKLYTVQGYALKDYDIQVWANNQWLTIATVKGNQTLWSTNLTGCMKRKK